MPRPSGHSLQATSPIGMRCADTARRYLVGDTLILDRRRSRMFTVKRAQVLGQALGQNADGAQMSGFFKLLDCQMAEREGFEPPIRLPVCRISSAVLSTTQPPLQKRRRKIAVSAGYVSAVTRRNKGVDSWRQRALSAASLV
jgi:hypothetical protein